MIRLQKLSGGVHGTNESKLGLWARLADYLMVVYLALNCPLERV